MGNPSTASGVAPYSPVIVVVLPYHIASALHVVPHRATRARTCSRAATGYRSCCRAAIAALALWDARGLWATAHVSGAATLEALLGTPVAFDARIHEVRGQPGQSWSATLFRALTAESDVCTAKIRDDGYTAARRDPMGITELQAVDGRCSCGPPRFPRSPR